VVKFNAIIVNAPPHCPTDLMDSLSSG